jgi:type IV secretion system protein VirB1
MLIECLLYLSTLCVRCGPTVDPATTQAIIKVESGGNPYAVGDNTLRRSFAPKSKAEAVRLASFLLSQGHSIDMGLMQINSIHLRDGRISLEDVFDPCANVKAGTGILMEYIRKFDNGTSKGEVLFKALSAYNTGSAWRGPDYINRILRAANAQYRVVVVNPPKEARKPRRRTGERKNVVTRDVIREVPHTAPPHDSPLVLDGEESVSLQ